MQLLPEIFHPRFVANVRRGTRKFVAIELHPAVYVSVIAVNLCLCLAFRELSRVVEQPIAEEASESVGADSAVLAEVLAHLKAREAGGGIEEQGDGMIPGRSESGGVSPLAAVKDSKDEPAASDSKSVSGDVTASKATKQALKAGPGAALAQASAATKPAVSFADENRPGSRNASRKKRSSSGGRKFSGLVPPPPPNVMIVPPPPDAPSIVANGYLPPPPPASFGRNSGASDWRASMPNTAYNRRPDREADSLKVVTAG